MAKGQLFPSIDHSYIGTTAWSTHRPQTLDTASQDFPAHYTTGTFTTCLDGSAKDIACSRAATLVEPDQVWNIQHNSELSMPVPHIPDKYSRCPSPALLSVHDSNFHHEGMDLDEVIGGTTSFASTSKPNYVEHNGWQPSNIVERAILPDFDRINVGNSPYVNIDIINYPMLSSSSFEASALVSDNDLAMHHHGNQVFNVSEAPVSHFNATPPLEVYKRHRRSMAGSIRRVLQNIPSGH